MAALRRLIPSFTNSSKTGTFTARKQTSSKATKALKVTAAGVCVSVAAGACYYYYRCSVVGRRSGPANHVEARLLHLALPSVSATDKIRTYGLDDGDVYMSSYENRFRLFSSVEYEGQLYMTPLNFIESVTLNEPKTQRSWRWEGGVLPPGVKVCGIALKALKLEICCHYKAVPAKQRGNLPAASSEPEFFSHNTQSSHPELSVLDSLSSRANKSLGMLSEAEGRSLLSRLRWLLTLTLPFSVSHNKGS
ncbi:hypothetical protein PAMP_023404 [Pampus punctatissimus]